MNEKLPDNGIELKSDTSKKLENFWYYNKWRVIVGVFLLAVLTVCIVQCATRDINNVSLLYAGPYSSQNEATVTMRNELTAVMPESVGTDRAGLIVLEIYSEEQIEELASREDAIIISSSGNSSNYSNFNQLLFEGEYVILLLDPWLYNETKTEGIFVPLAETFGESLPDGAFDDYAIKLSETDFYRSHPNGIGSLPSDTLLCLRKLSTMKQTINCSGESVKVSSEYAKSVTMYKTIVNYKEG